MQFWKWEFTFGWVRSEAMRSTASPLRRPITADHICWAAWNSPWQHSLSVPTKVVGVEEVLRSANRTQWGLGGRGGGARSRREDEVWSLLVLWDASISCDTRTNKPFFFFSPPVFNYIAGLKFTHTQLQAHLHNVHTYTLTRSFERQLSSLTWLRLASYSERSFESPLQRVCLPCSTFTPNAGWQFHKTKTRITGEPRRSCSLHAKAPTQITAASDAI